MAGLGIGFQPGANGENSDRPGVSSARPAQSAIQLLNLRLPTSAGPSAIAPQALLNAPGGAGLGGDAGINLLRALMALSGAQIPPAPMAGPSAQAPSGPPAGVAPPAHSAPQIQGGGGFQPQSQPRQTTPMTKIVPGGPPYQTPEPMNIFATGESTPPSDVASTDRLDLWRTQPVANPNKPKR